MIAFCEYILTVNILTGDVKHLKESDANISFNELYSPSLQMIDYI